MNQVGTQVASGRALHRPQQPQDDRPTGRHFNPYRRPAKAAAQALVSDVCQIVEKQEHRLGTRQRARRPRDQATFEVTVAALICEAAYRQLTAPGSWVAVSLSKQVLGYRNRYTSTVMGKTLPDLLGLLAAPSLGLLEAVKGQKGVSGFLQGRMTIFKAGRRLQTLLRDKSLTAADFQTAPSETIVLKRSKVDPDKGKHFRSVGIGSAYLDYEDSPETIRYRQEMDIINKHLAEADIDTGFETDKQVDITDRSLRRVFNNGSFEEGGRLFGGFWQEMKKEERRNGGIFIDDEPAVELDYGQMGLRIAYSLAEALPPEGDLYLLPGFENGREAVKKGISAMLSGRKRRERFPKGGRFGLRCRWEELERAIIAHHSPVAHLFYSGSGMRAMFLESQVLVAVLLGLIRQGITALPIHDAILVPNSAKELGVGIMLSTFRDILKVDGVVSTTS